MLKTITAMQIRLADARTRLHRDETGATAVEYGLMVGLIAVVIITAVAALGDNLEVLFDRVADEVEVTP